MVQLQYTPSSFIERSSSWQLESIFCPCSISNGIGSGHLDICSHWWINQGYDQSCLEEAEYLASLTPVRLDLLLSLTKTEHKGPVENEKHEVMNDFQFCSAINHNDDYIAGG